MALPGETPVLIVGGSLAGLSTALFLAHHGTPSLVLERQMGPASLPRAAHFHLRTVELFRSVGIEAAVRRRSEIEFAPEGAIVAVESLAGRQIAAFVPSLNEGVEALSPCRRLFVSQPGLEPILRDRAEALGARVLGGVELAGFSQEADGVTASIRNVETGETGEVRARYLVGADGGRSEVRRALGLGMAGRAAFSNSMTVYFHADLVPLLGDRNLSVIYVSNPTLGGFFRLARDGRSGFLVVNTLGDTALPGAENAAADTSETQCVALVRAAAGVADLPVRIDGVMRWRASAEVAEGFQAGRVFLAGDAAHLVPPNGGFGGNTAIQDAHNLAWKLAAVVNGAASPELLASYAAERRPVAALTAEQAYTRYVLRTAPYLGAEGVQPVVSDFDLELGYIYRSAAVLSEDETGPAHEDPHRSFGLPGRRAPHLWLQRGAERISTLDLFGRQWVLIAGAQGQAWRKAAAGLALGFHAVDGVELADPDDRFAQAYGLSPSGAALVRPDGFVAWRAVTAPHAPETVLAATLARLGIAGLALSKATVA